MLVIVDNKKNVRYEMGKVIKPKEESKSVSSKETDFLEMALLEVRSSLSIETLQVVWGNYKELQSDKRFVEAVTRRKGELK